MGRITATSSSPHLYCRSLILGENHSVELTFTVTPTPIFSTLGDITTFIFCLWYMEA